LYEAGELDEDAEIRYQIENEDTPNLPQAAVNEPGQHGVQIGSLGVPDKIIVVPAPERQGEMF